MRKEDDIQVMPGAGTTLTIKVLRITGQRSPTCLVHDYSTETLSKHQTASSKWRANTETVSVLGKSFNLRRT